MNVEKHIVIAGGTGFIGQHLIRRFIDRGFFITVLSRNPKGHGEYSGSQRVKFTRWDTEDRFWYHHLDGVDAVINLSGRSLMNSRWTQSVRKSILDSRVTSTNAVVEALLTIDHPPPCLIQVSAVGYYGTQTGRDMDETFPNGEGFLANVTRKWEDALAPLSNHPVIRTIVLRSGVVLGPDGGLFLKTACLARHFMGAVIGSGDNWMSWIHIDDLISAFEWMIEKTDMTGIYNSVSPHPVKSRDYMVKLTRILHRPLMPAPPVVLLRLALGEIVDELILASQHITPRRLQSDGFTFQYPDIDSALKSLHEDSFRSDSKRSGDCRNEIRWSG